MQLYLTNQGKDKQTMNTLTIDKKIETLAEDKQQAIQELIDDFNPIVDKIEKRLATTKGHYQEYMTLLNTDNKIMMYYILKKAGCVHCRNKGIFVVMFKWLSLTFCEFHFKEYQERTKKCLDI